MAVRQMKHRIHHKLLNEAYYSIKHWNETDQITNSKTAYNTDFKMKQHKLHTVYSVTNNRSAVTLSSKAKLSQIYILPDLLSGSR